MIVPQVPAAAQHPVWPREAIHDTVAAIVRQAAYRRDLRATLLDRILQWLSDLYERLIATLGGLPHGRAIATAAAVTIAMLVVARVAYAARLRVPSTESREPGRRVVARATDPWREAEQLAAAGQFTEAAHALYRAALVMLASHGLIRVHEAKTSGDYARELRRHGAPAHAAFRRFGARYDRIIYGTGICDAADYQALLDGARGIAAARGGERAA
jgi:hypothetical protein